LSPYGIRSLSAVHRDKPFVFDFGGQRNEVRYVPGESDSGLFGGNSNWRGPIWFPLNFADPSAEAIPHVLWRFVQGRMSDRFRKFDDDARSRPRTGAATDNDL
jgi:hypothetical protein